jgi:cysteine desulfurase/selenocysteine lyase
VEHPPREGRGGVAARRRDFPLLDERFHGKPLVYLDNAATTQKPRVVLDRLARFYEHENANVQRGVYALG